MSKYEKIAAVVISIFVLASIGFSYHEIAEPKDDDHEREPNFQHSLGQNIKIGTFATVLSKQSSGPMEQNCKLIQPVILSTFHNIDEHLEELSVYKPGVFEINQQTLDLFCYQNASLTLNNEKGGKLILVKLPFARSVPLGGTTDDIGTDVRINATVISPGAVPASQPTTYGEELVPDRLLERSEL